MGSSDQAQQRDLRPEPARSARAAGLRYVTDDRPGIRRERRRKGFRYLHPDGTPVDDAEVRARIDALALPPAWTDVWICPNPNGHLQATGRDEKGRKQYRYHARWAEVRNETKFNRMIAFCEALPCIRERVEEDLGRRGLPREKVLAAAIRLLEATLIRVGNAEYARDNGSYGLTTLRDRHVEVSGKRVRFSFRGKSGKNHEVDLKDSRLARIVKQCRDIPGYALFQYYDDAGDRQTIDSADVNAYLREITGQDFTAKDFRTWAGTLTAALVLQGFDPCGAEADARKNVVEAIRAVAERLGNTPAVCREYYVHPALIDAYIDQSLLACFERQTTGKSDDRTNGLDPDEQMVLAFLKERAVDE